MSDWADIHPHERKNSIFAGSHLATAPWRRRSIAHAVAK